MDRKERGWIGRRALLLTVGLHAAVNGLFVLCRFLFPHYTEVALLAGVVGMMAFLFLYFLAEYRCLVSYPDAKLWAYPVCGIVAMAVMLLLDWLIVANGLEFLPQESSDWFAGLEYVIFVFFWGAWSVLAVLADLGWLVIRYIIVSKRGKKDV